MTAKKMLMGTTILALMLPGCTSLKVAKPSFGNAPLEGINYALPSLRYKFTVSHLLIDCVNDQPDFKTDIAVSSSYEPGETYNIDYESMSKFLKTSAFELQNYEEDKEKGIPAGILKSINLESEDKSIAVIESVAKIGISIARMAAIGGTAEAKDQAGPKCPTERLQDLSRHKDELKILAKSLIDELAKRKPYEYGLDIGVIPEKDRPAVEAILSKTSEIEGKISKHKKAISEIEKSFSFLEIQYWRPDVDPEFLVKRDKLPALQSFRLPFFEDGVESASLERQKKWLSDLFSTDVKPGSDFGKSLRKLGVVLVLEPLVGWSDAAAAPTNPTPKVRAGVYYRDRAPARLRLCRPTAAYPPFLPVEAEIIRPANATDSEYAALVQAQGVIFADKLENYRRRATVAGWTKDEAARCQVNPAPLLIDEIRNVPQAGQLMVLPFTNGFGEKSTLKASFSPSGMLTSFSFGRTGGGEKAAAAASGFVTEIALLKKDLDAEKEANKKAAKAADPGSIESIKADIELQKAKQELEKLTSPPPDMTGLVTQKMVDQAKLDYDLAKARADLVDLRTKVAAAEKKS